MWSVPGNPVVRRLREVERHVDRRRDQWPNHLWINPMEQRYWQYTQSLHMIREIFGQDRNEHVPLIVPMTLINHYVRKYDQPYLKQQTYLNPHPLELKLRTH